jgi:hypothetical protein
MHFEIIFASLCTLAFAAPSQKEYAELPKYAAVTTIFYQYASTNYNA